MWSVTKGLGPPLILIAALSFPASDSFASKERHTQKQCCSEHAVVRPTTTLVLTLDKELNGRSCSCSVCRYMWVDSNEYDGEWHAGKMEGQGTFVWKTGERYDGEWVVSA